MMFMPKKFWWPTKRPARGRISLDHDHPVRPHGVLWPRKSRLPLKQTPTRLAQSLENVHILDAPIKCTRRQTLARHIVAKCAKQRMNKQRTQHTERSVMGRNTFLHCLRRQNPRREQAQRHVRQQDRRQDMSEAQQVRHQVVQARRQVVQRHSPPKYRQNKA
jgi:hypothetical protein